MDGLTLINHARAAGLTVVAAGDRLVIKGPSSAEPLVRALGRHKAAVLDALTTGESGDGDTTPANTGTFEGSVTVTTPETPAATLAQLRRCGLFVLADASGRVYLTGPPEAVATMPVELVEAMDKHWPSLWQVALPDRCTDTLEEIDCPPPCQRCGSLAFWWPIVGEARCLACDPPARALRTLERAERVRRTHGLASPTGIAEDIATLRRTIADRCESKRLEPVVPQW